MAGKGKQTNTTEVIEDAFLGVLDSIARFLFFGGILATVVSVALLIFTFQSVAAFASPQTINAALFNIDIYNKILLGGVVALFVGATYRLWGEETLSVIFVIASALLFFGPPFIPSMFGNPTGNEASESSLNAIRNGGIVLGVLSLGLLVADLTIRARQRMREGAKSDLLKYGKGIKEEREVNNVLLGKCYQLPFCRKFVRERCPIYHSKRTCWREQVGCMCEEQVIRDAMEGKAFPKDEVAAAKFIPVNNRLTKAQKFERCKQCVIYNEHQKHKYKIAIPGMVVAFVAVYVLFRPQLLEAVKGLIVAMDRMVGRITFNTSGNVGNNIVESGIPFQEILLISFMLILFTYALRTIEYAIFKLKV